MTDSTIYSMAAEGNLQAQSRLFTEHKNKIYSVAYFYTRNRQDAEEILQRTFIQAFKWIKKKDFESNRHFSS
jgi:DNA-directed RNA polymerase specialized sigma24 family protein